MTLGVSLASFRFVLQVTDRLVTTTGGSVHDPLANKNVVFRALDGLVSITFTGLAFIGDEPTDMWIGRILTASPPERDHWGIRFGRARNCYDLGRAMTALRDGLSARGRELRAPIEITMAGWQWKRTGAAESLSQARPIVWSLTTPGGGAPSGGFSITRSPRWIGRTQFLLDATPSGWLTADDLERLKSAMKGIRTVDEAEQIVLAAIRRVAAQTPAVGAHCMTVLLPPPPVGCIFVAFRPAVEHRAQLNPSSQTIPVAFTPYVAGPDVSIAPSVAVGGGFHSPAVGGFRLGYDAPASVPPLKSLDTERLS